MMKIAHKNSVENIALELQNEILSFAVGLLTSIIIESKRVRIFVFLEFILFLLIYLIYKFLLNCIFHESKKINMIW